MIERARAGARRNGLVHEVLHPAGWPLPSGYVNGVAAKGRMVFTGGRKEKADDQSDKYDIYRISADGETVDRLVESRRDT